ncbi:hypothetical protein [Rhizobium sp. R693]|uniref:hypothetical protein n=1 Tax=Rhizobium sp. R693 TaxID=1764276 RepID=UPI000B5350D6|nr:hypothetical protein [Rhizobium sp. R693]OWV99981.1 hypothetical protein ATY79_01095 [Rhizobium sp. R693]
MPVRFIDRKDEIRDALVRVAEGGEPVTYEKFGDEVGIWRMRGAKDLLDLIAKEEKSHGRPDVTYMLKSATSGYPSQIGGQLAKPPADWQKRLACEEMQKIIKEYCPGKRQSNFRPKVG